MAGVGDYSPALVGQIDCVTDKYTDASCSMRLMIVIKGLRALKGAH